MPKRVRHSQAWCERQSRARRPLACSDPSSVTRTIRPLAAGLEGSDRERRAILVASQLIGIALHRYIVKVEPLASADFESIVASVAPTIQRYVSGE